MTTMIPTSAPLAADAYTPTSHDVRQHMHLVYKVVGQMQRKLPRSVQRDDLVSAGSVGLLAALRRSGGDVGSPSFECYACIRIRGAILDELRTLDWSPRRRKPNATAPATSPATEPVALAPVTVVRFDDLPPMNEPMAATGCPEEPRLAQDTRRAILAAIATLPEREREIVELRYFEDVPVKEIAAKLGVSEARISQLHSRATAAMRKHLVDLDPRVVVAAAKDDGPTPSKFPTPPASRMRRRVSLPAPARTPASIDYRQAA
jgi:RNA polymerase sigma factor for flagellar operon FliA